MEVEIKAQANRDVTSKGDTGPSEPRTERTKITATT